jgi:hypothetical protein
MTANFDQIFARVRAWLKERRHYNLVHLFARLGLTEPPVRGMV